MANKDKIDRLQKLLRELFQYENNDLDFGIYKILNVKKKEISEFIDMELFDIIKQNIKNVEDNLELKEEVDNLKTELENLYEENIETIKTKFADKSKVKEYLDKLKELKTADGENDLEEEIYDDIYNFFSRYYDKGDFISKRRYSKDSKYAIPYNGEEVHLHWANSDQYYIKTSEEFKNYTSNKIDEVIIKFEIIDADVELNNIKDNEKKFFIYYDSNYDSSKKELVVQFEWRGLTTEEENLVKEFGKKLDNDTLRTYNLSKIDDKLGVLKPQQLNKKHILSDGNESEKSEIEWHLNKYTTKNSTDYFIHKDLKKFLSQELDFYIKNELLYIDEIDSRTDLEINLKRIRVFKEIAKKIIEFLSQIENFQKKIWEKKKFVINTDYCITLDWIKPEYYIEILSNDKQLEEWKNLFDFDINEKLKTISKTLTSHGKSDDEKKIDMLKQNPTLSIDTKFFDSNFKYKILSEIEDLDENTNGILINSENYQALNLLLNKYKEKVKCCYIDPPYNTDAVPIIYKNNYKHSSWNSLMYDRLLLSNSIISKNGFMNITIDYAEILNLGKISDQIFGEDNRLGFISILHNPEGRQNARYYTVTDEYMLTYRLSESSNFNSVYIQENFKDSKNIDDVYNHTDEKGKYKEEDFIRLGGGNDSLRINKPNGWYPIYVSPDLKELSLNKEQGYFEIFPITDSGQERTWKIVKDSFNKKYQSGDLYSIKENNKIKIKEKYRIDKGSPITTCWINKKYNSKKGGTDVLNSLSFNQKFSFPKSVYAVKDVLSIMSKTNELILDYFAGSGTTGHATLKLNKEDQGNRKFILVEMGHHFNNVLKPRIQKVIFSDNWKAGKPQDNDGSKKQIIKYHSLEQYEDSLNNIPEDLKQPNLVAQSTKDYKLKYMLEFESRDSNVFLNIESLENPFNYKLKVEKNNESQEQNIDLVETFNYLAGIFVKSIQKLSNNKKEYVVVKGKRDGKDIIVIWRNTADNFDPIKDKEFIVNEILKEEYDEILVNGNSLVPEAKSLDVIFKENMFN